MVKILKCEDLDSPPVGPSDIPEHDQDLFNVHLNRMYRNQWYSFDGEYGVTVYIKLQSDMTLIQTLEKPEK